MKRILFLLCALLGLGASGAWAQTYMVTLGSQVTDLSTLSASKYYVLKNCGTSKYNYYDGTQMAAKADLVYGSVVKLNHDGTNVTIQQLNNNLYYQGLVSETQITIGDSPVNFTFNTDGVDAGQFRFANNNLFLNRRGGDDAPIGYTQEDKGDFSRWNIFEVTVPAVVGVVGKTFTMQCARGYVYYDGNFLKGTNTASSASKFAIVSYDGATYLYDATNNAFVCHTTAATAGTTGNAALESSDDFSKAVKNISFGDTNIEAYPYYVQEDEFTNWLNMDGNSKVYFNRWTNFEGGKGGNTYKIEIVDTDFDATDAIAMLDSYFNPAATVTYVISDASGVIYTSEAIAATVGATVTELPADLQRPYCSYDVTSTNIVAGANTVDVTVTYTLPFTVSTSFDNATWYYATLRGTKYVRADESAKDGSGRYQTSTTNEKTDVYKWAFFGNPYGIYVMNKGQGEGKYLYAPNTTAPTFQSVTDPTADNAALWEASPNSNGNFNLRSLTGSTLYINDSAGSGNLGLWNSSAATSDNGSNWVISEVPAATVDVTYELWVGGEKVNTVVVEQVAANSDVNVPASLTSGYSSLAYDFETSGTIGSENCAITVTGTMKAGVITAISQLSNGKAYTLNTTRGSLGTNGTQMVSTNGTSYSSSNFAIISYEDNYYLWSVADSKWVGNPTTIDGVNNQPSLTIDLNNVSALVFDGTNATTASPLFFMGYGSNGVNVSNYSTGIVVNSWTTRDPGNQYCIIEAADFDATDALAALDEYFHPSAEAQFKTAIEELEAINWGTGLNQYKLVIDGTDYTSEVAETINNLKQQGYTEENLIAAQQMLANYSLNMPSAGFYRIKGNTSGKYLAAGLASNNKFNMTEATDGTTIFYFDGTTLTNLSSGYCNGMTSDAWAWVLGEYASTVVFQDGLTNGGYGIKSATCNFYDNGDGSNSADRGNNVTISSETNSRYTSWYLEEANTLPVTISAAGYATLYAPVALTIPEGVTASTLTIGYKDHLDETNVEVTIPANTPVMLSGDNGNPATSGTYNFTIAEDVPAINQANKLIGTIAAIAAPDESYILQNHDEVVGFYQVDTSVATPNVPGFRAYIPALDSSVKAFFFGDTATGINAIKDASVDGEIYDLSGRRVSKMQRGVYVVGGKKVAVK